MISIEFEKPEEPKVSFAYDDAIELKFEAIEKISVDFVEE